MSPSLATRAERESGLFLVFGLGLGLFATHLVHAANAQEGFETFLVGILVPLLFSGVLVLGGVWLVVADLRPNHLLRVGLWTVLVAGILAAGQLLTIRYQQAEGVQMSHVLFVLANAATAGAVVGFVIGIYDAGQQRARSRAEQLQSQLTVLNRVLRHDIRNGATVIQGRADLVESRLEETEHVDRIQQQAADLVQLGEHARTIEELQRDTDDPRQPVDIGERLTAHVEDLRTTHPAADISTSIEVGTRVYAHPLIDSAIENLLENAVQHAGPNPDVDVVCRQSDEPGDGAVEVRIADDGPGIPPTEVEVLERGYETPLDHTSGLGLWIVNWIVTESGGSVWFEANEPEGSIVCFRLEPVEAEGPALPATLAN